MAITSDLAVGTELARIEIKVSKRDGTDVVSTQKLTLVGKSPKAGEATLPVSFAIGKGKEGSFLLAVSGYGPMGPDGGEEKVVEQRSIATFQPGKTLLLEVRLARVCLKQLCNDDPHMVCYLSDMGMVNAGECGEIPTLGKADLKIVDPAKLAKLVMMSGSGGEGTSGAGGQNSTVSDAGGSDGDPVAECVAAPFQGGPTKACLTCPCNVSDGCRVATPACSGECWGLLDCIKSNCPMRDTTCIVMMCSDFLKGTEAAEATAIRTTNMCFTPTCSDACAGGGTDGGTDAGP